MGSSSSSGNRGISGTVPSSNLGGVLSKPAVDVGTGEGTSKFSFGGAATGIAGAVIGGVGAAIGGRDRPPGEIRLPPELEAEQIELLASNVQDFERERALTQAAVGQLEGIAQTQFDLSSGLLPSKEGLQRLTQQTQEFGQQFGDLLPGVVQGIADDLASSDFGNELEVNAREALQQQISSTKEFKDPTVERQLEEGRAQLSDRLAAQFGPGFENTEAGIRALQAFEQGATELRFDTSQRGRANEVARLQGIIGGGAQARGTQLAGIQQRQQFGQQLFQGQQAALGQLGSQVGAQNIAANTLLSSRELGRQGLGLANQPFGLFQQFGSQNISGDTRDFLRQGDFAGFQTSNERFPNRQTQAQRSATQQQNQFFQENSSLFPNQFQNGQFTGF